MKEALLALKAKNISKSVAAERLGIGHCKFTRLLKLYGINWPNQLQALRVEWQGHTGTFAEHSKRTGIDPGTLRDRWNRHKSLDLPSIKKPPVKGALSH